MESEERYKHLNKYLKEKFGERTLKICIDGGFTCPNRDGTLSTKGCIFCSEKGSGELIRCGSGNTIIEKISNHRPSSSFEYLIRINGGSDINIKSILSWHQKVRRGGCRFGNKKKTAEGGLFGAYWEW